MYKVLIVAATRGEIEPLLAQYQAQKSLLSNKVFSFSHRRCHIDALITGVGMVATAYEMAFWLSRRNYDLLLNAGVCGSFNRDIPLGTALQITSDEIADWGAETDSSFIPMAELDFFDANQPPYEKGILRQKIDLPLQQIIPLLQVHGITVNKTSGNARQIKQLQKRYRAQVETMESAAFFYAARSINARFAAIRTISNYVEPRNTDNWDLAGAIDSLNQALNIILNACPIK